jgi:hypothetical protein
LYSSPSLDESYVMLKMFAPEIVACVVDQMPTAIQNRALRPRQQVITVKDAKALPIETSNERHREIMTKPSDRLI